MSDKLQRVGLVFKADGSVDFNKSLKEVTASIQENRTAFELVKSTWDDSTKTAEKLKETQKYLSEQTKDYSDKVTLLSRQLDELEAAENRDERAIQNKRNQLNQAKIIASHDLNMIMDTCERTILLSDGKVIKDGNTKEILLDKELMEESGLELPLGY